jgi:ribonuclease HI
MANVCPSSFVGHPELQRNLARTSDWIFRTDGACFHSRQTRAGGAGCVLLHVENGLEIPVWCRTLHLPNTTNNVAEYQGLLLALNAMSALNLSGETSTIILDSQLIVNQMTGVNRCLKPELIVLHRAAKRLMEDLHLPRTVFRHQLRRHNAVADFLSKISAEDDRRLEAGVFYSGWNLQRIGELLPLAGPVPLQDPNPPGSSSSHVAAMDEADDDSSVNSGLSFASADSTNAHASASSSLNCPFHDCTSRCKDADALQKHFNKCHRDGSIEVMNSLQVELQCVFTRCNHCSQVCKAKGLARHISSAHPAAAQAAVTNQRAARDMLRTLPNYVPPAPRVSVPIDCPSLDSLAGLAELISFFRREFDNLPKSVVDYLSRVMIRLLGAMSIPDSAAASPLDPVSNAAAFLLLPGLLRYLLDENRDILAFLSIAQHPPDGFSTASWILQGARDLIRNGIVSRGGFVPPERSEPQSHRKIEALLNRGRQSAAMRVAQELHQKSLNPDAASPPPLPKDAQQALLASLNPSASELDTLAPPISPREFVPLSLDTEDVRYAVLKAQLSTSTGWTGWSNALIRRVVIYGAHSNELLEVLCKFYNTWGTGTLSADVASLFATARGVLIPKDGGSGYRPLGIGESWYRIGCRCYLSRFAFAHQRMLPLQLGAGSRGGAEIAARSIQLMLDLDGSPDDRHSEDVCIGSFDIRNAFNSLRRSFVLTGIRKIAPALEPIFRLFYGSPTAIRFSNGEFACTSATGVRQGDPLSSLLFGLGFHETLRELQDAMTSTLGSCDLTVETGLVVAYADDVNWACPARCIPDFAAKASDIFSKYDLVLASEKCAIHGRLAGEIENPPYPVLQAGISRVLGVPIGPPAFCLDVTANLLESMCAPLPTVEKLSPQAALILTGKCINARASYVARIIDVPGIQEKLKVFDNRITNAVRKIARCPESYYGTLHSIRTLPLHKAGLGMYDHGGISGRYACNQSRLLTEEFLRERYMHLYRQSDHSWPATTFHSMVPGTRTVLEKHAKAEVKDAREDTFQEVVQAKLAERKLADAAVFRSNKCGGSGKFLAWRGCATHRAFQCGPVEFRDALRRRVLAPTASYEEHALARAPCNCGQGPAITGHVTHSQDCKRNQWYYNCRHDRVRDALANFLRCTHPDGSVRKEIILEPGLDGRRMDIVFQIAECTYHLDVAVTNPACMSNLRKGAHKKADAASKAKERKKHAKYSDLPGLAAGGEGGMTPFVVESTGRLGPSALKFPSY